MREVPEEILDATAGGRSIWLDENKDHEDTLYIDRREEKEGFAEEGTEYHQTYSVQPDEVQDFRDLPYKDGSFNLIIFDPPHVVNDGGMSHLSGIVQRRYGALNAETWQSDLKQGFDELFRVLSPGGTLVFKFADNSIDFDQVLKYAPRAPLFGTTTKKKNTEVRWFVFYKPE